MLGPVVTDESTNARDEQSAPRVGRSTLEDVVSSFTAPAPAMGPDVVTLANGASKTPMKLLSPRPIDVASQKFQIVLARPLSPESQSPDIAPLSHETLLPTTFTTITSAPALLTTSILSTWSLSKISSA
jgi:hypothetical protein